MQAIQRKLWRDLWHIRYQAAAICLVMACGVAMIVMSLSTLDSLSQTRDAYYERTNFADVFARLKRAPNSLIERLREIPGVAQAETRVVVGVTLDVRGLTEPATGILISVPDFHRPAVNRLYLRSGRWVEPNRANEVLVAEAFANAHALQPGESIRVIINGRLQELRVVGIVLSPEYIYSVPPGELLPDDKRFGVLWMNYTALATAFDLDGAFNDVSLRLLPGAQEEEVISRVDRLLNRYGSQGAFGRDQQPSYRFLDNEMKQLETMAFVPPVIFLGVTAFLLQMVLSRLIATEREQIATLRAFGYTRAAVAWHYLGYAGMMIAIGAALGTPLGAWFGYGLTRIYIRFFHFPAFDYYLDARIVVVAVAASGAAALFGTLRTVVRAASESPAAAMQPEPPPRYKATILERLGLAALLPPAARMILRHLEREPVRAALTTLGIALSIAIVIMGNFSHDMIEYVMDIQFHQANRQSLSVTFTEPTTGRVVNDLRHLPGVSRVEPFRAVPARLRNGPRNRRLAIMGLAPESQLFRLIDTYAEQVALPPEGLVISAKLAEILKCGVGDEIEVEVLEAGRPKRRVAVVNLIEDVLDLNAYMDIRALNRLMREQNSISGAFLQADARDMPRLYAELKQTPRVAGVTIKENLLENYRQTMAENVLIIRAINVLFATVVAFGVVYNCARISLAERSRELATLRVLGFTRRETSFLLLGEMAVLAALAIPLGMLIGYALAWIMIVSLDTEVHRFPLIINRSTYALGITVTLVASVISALIVRRRLDHFDLVAVLKTRD